MNSAHGSGSRIPTAEHHFLHDVALGEDAGNHAVFVDHRGGAYAVSQHRLIGLATVASSGTEAGVSLQMERMLIEEESS